MEGFLGLHPHPPSSRNFNLAPYSSVKTLAFATPPPSEFPLASCGGHMDIFWNFTFPSCLKINKSTSTMAISLRFITLGSSPCEKQKKSPVDVKSKLLVATMIQSCLLPTSTYHNHYFKTALTALSISLALSSMALSVKSQGGMSLMIQSFNVLNTEKNSMDK